MTAESKKNLTKKILSAIWWIAVILLAILLVRIVGAKMRGEAPTIFGYSVINIISGSMEDEIPKGSYILVKSTHPSKVEKGDVICFYSTDPLIYGMLNTHRVVEDPLITDNGIEFVTRGDANPANDAVTARGDRLVGVYVKKLDTLTAFSNFLSGNAMIIVIIGLQISIVSLIVYSVAKAKHSKENDSENGENNSSD